VVCDRCKALCTDYNVLEIQAEPIRRSVAQSLDLCGDCMGEFVGFMRAPVDESEYGIGGALQDTAVASMQLDASDA